MIEDLIGARKISIPFPCNPSTSPVFTANSNGATATSAAKAVNSSNSSSGGNSSSNNNSNSNSNSNNNTNQNNLRCPRCDSTNTKFCYYNNYNLTQPRHFCKTCRRYWTKGGTLRNVPIGGGCRKNKTTTTSSATSSGIMSMSKSSSNAAVAKASKAANFSTEMILNGGCPGFLGQSGLVDHLLPYHEFQTLTPPLWPSLQQGQSSHILALLRGANPNPNPNPSSDPNPNLNPSLGLDPYGIGAPSLLGSLLRTGNHHPVNGFGLGAQDVGPNGVNNSSNILDVYQRLKATANHNYCGIENPGSVNVLGSESASAMNSSILEGANGATENLGMGAYNNLSSPGINSSWSDLPIAHINGAFP